MICGDFFVFIDNPKGSLTGKNIEHSQTEAEIAKLKAETVKLNAKAAKCSASLSASIAACVRLARNCRNNCMRPSIKLYDVDSTLVARCAHLHHKMTV